MHVACPGDDDAVAMDGIDPCGGLIRVALLCHQLPRLREHDRHRFRGGRRGDGIWSVPGVGE